MAPRARKAPNARLKDFGNRFGIHSRSLLDKRAIGRTAFLQETQAAGVDVSIAAVM